MSDGVCRRALCIGIGRFTPESANGSDEPDLTRFGDLEYAAEYTRELHAALGSAGYDADLVVDPAALDEKQVGQRVNRYLDGGGVAVVHVLSHGGHTLSGGVYVVGANGVWSRETRVEDWRIAVADKPSAPMTLFLLDLCHAGAAIRHWEPPPAGAHEKAWVIAAAGANEPAYAGRFTRAATTVIHRITSGELDLAPTVRMVGFDVLYERIRKEVGELRIAEGGYEQHLTATPVVAGALPELPFFHNPGYVPNPAAQAAAATDPSTAPFVDLILDEEHFRDRAAGHGPAASRITAGCFTGRAPQLRALSAWLDGEGDAGVRLVTGSPGAGKSALLGVLVCAAHPDLRGATQDLWRGAAARPSENPELAAVHARHRALPVILRSLTTQLHLDTDLPDGDLTAAAVIGAITGRPRPPVVVVDAVDETLNPRQLVDQFLIPLARARRADGTLACRLLVGMRPWSEFGPLLDLARDIGEVLDLDAIPVDQRRADVTDYVAALLELLPRYATAPYSVWRRAFTQAIAATLVRDSPRASADSHEDGAEPRWGEFLVAALYTHTITLTSPEPHGDATDAARLGAEVPCTLPEVLELDLATRPTSRWRRPVLTALAHARGAGIPRSVLPAVAATVIGEVHGELATPSVAEVADELGGLRFYLRTGADTDGSTLYRFFHQSLADHLRGGPDRDPAAVAGQILDGLLTTIPVEHRSRGWDLAEPYLLRHAIQHASTSGRVDELLVDPGFLAHADPATLIPALHLARNDPARLAAAVYRVSAGEHPSRSADQRRDVLAIDAARYGAVALLDGFANTPDWDEMRWHPRWATGSQVSAALRSTLVGHASSIRGLACTLLDGRPVAISGSDDCTVRIWDLTRGIPIGEPLTGHTNGVAAVACATLRGRPVAVTAGWDNTVRIWDLTTGKAIGTLPIACEAVACTIVDGRSVAVLNSRFGAVQIWDLATCTQIGSALTDHGERSAALACTTLEGKPIAVTAGADRTARIWDLTRRPLIGDPLSGDTGAMVAVACTIRDGRPVAVTTRLDQTLQIWDLADRAALGKPLIGRASTARPYNPRGGSQGAACTEIDHKPVAVTAGSDSAVRLWDLTNGTPIGEPLTGHTSPVYAVACAEIDHRPVAVTGSGDETVRIWDLAGHTAMGEPLIGHADKVLEVTHTTRGDQPVAVSASRDGTVQIWDLARRTRVGHLTVRGFSVSWQGPVPSTMVRVACSMLEGRPVAVTCSASAVQVWSLIDCTAVGNPLTGHIETISALACTSLHGRPIAVTGGAAVHRRGHGLEIWDLATGNSLGDPLTGHTGRLRAVACTTIEGTTVAVTVSEDHSVQIWDLAARIRTGELTGHTDSVMAVACTMIDGSPVAITAGADRTVRTWDLATRTPIGDPLIGHTGTVRTVAFASLDGRTVAVTGGSDKTVRTWDLATRRQIDRICLPSSVNSLAVTTSGVITAAFGWEIVNLERVPRGEPRG